METHSSDPNHRENHQETDLYVQFLTDFIFECQSSSYFKTIRNSKTILATFHKYFQKVVLSNSLFQQFTKVKPLRCRGERYEADTSGRRWTEINCQVAGFRNSQGTHDIGRTETPRMGERQRYQTETVIGFVFYFYLQFGCVRLTYLNVTWNNLNFLRNHVLFSLLLVDAIIGNGEWSPWESKPVNKEREQKQGAVRNAYPPSHSR